MKTTTITISLPKAMGKEMETVAREEHRTLSELLRETFRQYTALRNLNRLAKSGKSAVKRKKLTERDFGGPFAK